MSANESNADVIEDLLRNPERSFARLLFESPPLGVIEVLSDLVLHPDNGHNATLQCLYAWQDLQNNPYTLSSILDEVQNAQGPDIVCACLTLVNRLIQHAPDSMKRIQIRRELEKIRFEEHLAAVSKCVALSERLRAASEKFSILVHQPASAFVTCVPVANFCATDADSGTFSSEEDEVMNGTVDEHTPNGSTSEPKLNGEISSQINNLISSFDSDDALELLIKLLKQLQETKQPPTKVLKQLNDHFSQLSESPKPPSNGIPPAPPILASKNGKIPPPPRIQPSTSQKLGPPAPPLLKSGPPAPPALGQSPSTSTSNKVEVPQALKPKFTPPDGKKLRHLQWTKIPLNNLASATNNQSSSNVWLKMGNLNTDLLKNLDFAQLDSCFSCEPVTTDTQLNGANEKEAKNMTVSLLCAKRSLSINVFLKSLKGQVNELIAYIGSGQATDDGGVERLKMLVPLLPTEEELQTLKNYTGNREELGTAECFLFKLLDVADYKLRIESIILKEEFGAFISIIEPDLRTIISACQELRQSHSLQTILLILLHMGNYLNHNAALGNAVGFKLASLWKIDELRATKGGRTLLHLVSQQAEKANANLDEISHVDDAAKLAFEALKSELKTSADRVNKLENQLELKNDGFFEEIKIFLTDSKKRLDRSNELLTKIENERQQLAVYFCENEKTFSLEECFKIFSVFRSRFILATNENRQREEREKRMQEKNATGTQATSEAQPIISRPIVSETTRSPSTNRRTSVIVEQDRDRNAISPLLQSTRRKSSVAATRKDSAIFDKFNFDQNENNNQSSKSNDLSEFLDQAFELNSRRRQSRFSPMNSPLPRVQEFRETTNTFNDNKEVDEVKVAVPTIDSQLNKTEKISNENVKPTESTITRQKSIEKPTSKVTSASLVNSVMTRKNAPNSKYSPSSNRSMRSTGSGTTAIKTPPSSSNDPQYSRTTLRKVPPSPAPKTDPATPKEEPWSPAYRKQAISRIRARQSNEPTQKPQTPTPIQPLRPSQVRLAQTRLPSKSTLATQSSTTSGSSMTSRLSKTPTASTATKVEPRTSISSSVARKSPPTSRTALTGRTTTTSSRPPTAPSSKEPTTGRTPMTAAEKRNLFKQNTSLSTTSRPVLIRSGSKSEKPRWS